VFFTLGLISDMSV